MSWFAYLVEWSLTRHVTKREKLMVLERGCIGDGKMGGQICKEGLPGFDEMGEKEDHCKMKNKIRTSFVLGKICILTLI